MPANRIIVRHPMGGLLRAKGRADIDPSPFVAGVTKPNLGNSGLDTTKPPLIPYYGDITVTTNNVDLSGLDIFGFVKVRAAGCHGDNFRVRGSGPGTTNTGLIDCNHPSAASAYFKRVTLIPDYPSEWLNAIIGHDWTLEQALALNCVDGAGSYNSYAPAAAGNCTILGGIFDALSYWSPDPQNPLLPRNHSDNRTHNDGYQIQGNTNYIIRGPIIRGYCSTTAGSGIGGVPAPTADTPYTTPDGKRLVTGQAIGITPNVSQVNHVLIDRAWLYGGAQSLTIIPGSQGVGTDVVMTGTRFGRDQALITKSGVQARRPVVIDPSLSLPAFPSSTGPDTAGNVYEDDGSPITIYRVAG
jgi:hypothetical protein